MDIVVVVAFIYTVFVAVVVIVIFIVVKVVKFVVHQIVLHHPEGATTEEEGNIYLMFCNCQYCLLFCFCCCCYGYTHGKVRLGLI